MARRRGGISSFQLFLLELIESGRTESALLCNEREEALASIEKMEQALGKLKAIVQKQGTLAETFKQEERTK